MNKDITPYEHCLENNIKVIGLEKQPRVEHDFYYARTENPKHLEIFMDGLRNDSSLEITKGLHLKSEKYLELRMFTLVPYNIMGIQKGIQHEHSVTQFLVDHVIDADIPDERAIRWARSHKTVIVKNGGTSNEGHHILHIEGEIWYEGTMQQARRKLKELGVNFSEFYEPDLNSMLTGLSLIADERVFDRRKYPDFKDIPFDPETDGKDEFTIRQWEDNNELAKVQWAEMLGGDTNVELRKFLFSYKLA
jgi:hypothetical protein